jgi:RHS repeat-associated protein
VTTKAYDAMTDIHWGTTTYVYGDLGRLVSVSDPLTGTVEYGYDLVGNRTQLIYPDGRVVTYTYDADNRLIQVEDWDGGLTSYEYDAAGRLIHATLPNGVVNVNLYDDVNRLTQIEHKDAEENLLARYVYVLNQVGNRVEATETISIPVQGLVTSVITYTYDSLQRLIKTDYSTSEKFEYAYDGVGNRTVYTVTVGGNPQVTSYDYDAANRLVNAGGLAYTWDDVGRLLDDGTYQYAWNTAGQLITVTDGANTLEFRYDGDGNRLVRIVNGASMTYTLDVGLVLPEVLVNQRAGESATYYLHLSSGVATDDGGTWTYSAPDALGSVRQELDASGQVVSTNTYRPFGLPVAGDGGDPYGYTGEWWEDDAELLHLRARYLQVETGRFISQDPWPGHFRLPQTLNRYVYVENNPVTWLDPSGYASEHSDCGGDPRCLVFYFPGTGKVDNDYLNSPEYGSDEQQFIKHRFQK